jgi:imidazolonepropionase-like amidohydrolase
VITIDDGEFMALPPTRSAEPDGPRFLRAARALDGAGNLVVDAVLELDGTKIRALGSAAEFGSAIDGIARSDYGDATLLPGFIDTHAHVAMPADGRSYSEVVRDPDEVWALTAYENVARHLHAGVTTIRDNGARNRVTFAVRDFLRQRDLIHPRLLLAGRPVTRSNGHMAWCNGSADRPDDIRMAVRLLAAEGADHIKLVASGGGTPGTLQSEASYTADELRIAVEAARELGLRTTAHCHATSAIRNAVEAGVGCIEHVSFIRRSDALDPPRKQVGAAWTGLTVDYDPEVVEALQRSDCYLSLTLPGAYGPVLELRDQATRRELTAGELAKLAMSEEHVDRKLKVAERLVADGLGGRIVLGTDAGAGDTTFGRMNLALVLAVRGGMQPMAAIESGTRVAAEACGISGDTGTLEPGKAADVVVVDGDPLTDIGATGRVLATFRAGMEIAGPFAAVASRPPRTAR